MPLKVADNRLEIATQKYIAGLITASEWTDVSKQIANERVADYVSRVTVAHFGAVSYDANGSDI